MTYVQSGAVKRGKCDCRARAAERCHVLSLYALLLHLSDYVDNNGHDVNVQVNPQPLHLEEYSSKKGS